MECFFFILLNFLSYIVFKSLVRPVKSESTRLVRLGMGVIGLWVVLRMLNYFCRVSLVGLYTDEIAVLTLLFCIDFLFLSKLSDNNRFVRYVQHVRHWYSIFNGGRILLFLLGLLVYPARIIAYPLSNIDKTKDYHLIGPYWANKQTLESVWTIFDGQDDIVGRQDRLCIVKKGRLFRKVVFQRKYETSYRYFASSDPQSQVVQIGPDSVLDEDACFYLYRKRDDYYLTYLGDGEQCIGDIITTGGADGQVVSKRRVDRAYLDSSNRANGLPVGVQDYLLN